MSQRQYRSIYMDTAQIVRIRRLLARRTDRDPMNPVSFNEWVRQAITAQLEREEPDYSALSQPETD